MSDHFAATVIEDEIPIRDMTALERLVLGLIFTCQDAGDERVRYYADEGPADWVSPDPGALATARRDSSATSSRLNVYIDETLARYGVDPDIEVEIDMTGLCWECIFQDIVCRSATLKHVSTSTAFTCSKMIAGGFGGAASFITADAVLSQSTHDFLESCIDRFDAAAGERAA